MCDEPLRLVINTQDFKYPQYDFMILSKLMIAYGLDEPPDVNIYFGLIKNIPQRYNDVVDNSGMDALGMNVYTGIFTIPDAHPLVAGDDTGAISGFYFRLLNLYKVVADVLGGWPVWLKAVLVTYPELEEIKGHMNPQTAAAAGAGAAPDDSNILYESLFHDGHTSLYYNGIKRLFTPIRGVAEFNRVIKGLGLSTAAQRDKLSTAVRAAGCFEWYDALRSGRELDHTDVSKILGEVYAIYPPPSSPFSFPDLAMEIVPRKIAAATAATTKTSPGIPQPRVSSRRARGEVTLLSLEYKPGKDKPRSAGVEKPSHKIVIPYLGKIMFSFSQVEYTKKEIFKEAHSEQFEIRIKPTRTPPKIGMRTVTLDANSNSVLPWKGGTPTIIMTDITKIALPMWAGDEEASIYDLILGMCLDLDHDMDKGAKRIKDKREESNRGNEIIAMQQLFAAYIKHFFPGMGTSDPKVKNSRILTDFFEFQKAVDDHLKTLPAAVDWPRLMIKEPSAVLPAPLEHPTKKRDEPIVDFLHRIGQRGSNLIVVKPGTQEKNKLRRMDGPAHSKWCMYTKMMNDYGSWDFENKMIALLSPHLFKKSAPDDGWWGWEKWLEDPTAGDARVKTEKFKYGVLKGGTTKGPDPWMDDVVNAASIVSGRPTCGAAGLPHSLSCVDRNSFKTIEPAHHKFWANNSSSGLKNHVSCFAHFRDTGCEGGYIEIPIGRAPAPPGGWVSGDGGVDNWTAATQPDLEPLDPTDIQKIKKHTNIPKLGKINNNYAFKFKEGKMEFNNEYYLVPIYYFMDPVNASVDTLGEKHPGLSAPDLLAKARQSPRIVKIALGVFQTKYTIIVTHPPADGTAAGTAGIRVPLETIADPPPAAGAPARDAKVNKTFGEFLEKNAEDDYSTIKNAARIPRVPDTEPRRLIGQNGTAPPDPLARSLWNCVSAFFEPATKYYMKPTTVYVAKGMWGQGGDFDKQMDTFPVDTYTTDPTTLSSMRSSEGTFYHPTPTATFIINLDNVSGGSGAMVRLWGGDRLFVDVDDQLTFIGNFKPPDKAMVAWKVTLTITSAAIDAKNYEVVEVPSSPDGTNYNDAGEGEWYPHLTDKVIILSGKSQNNNPHSSAGITAKNIDYFCSDFALMGEMNSLDAQILLEYTAPKTSNDLRITHESFFRCAEIYANNDRMNAMMTAYIWYGFEGCMLLLNHYMIQKYSAAPRGVEELFTLKLRTNAHKHADGDAADRAARCPPANETSLRLLRPPSLPPSPPPAVILAPFDIPPKEFWGDPSDAVPAGGGNSYKGGSSLKKAAVIRFPLSRGGGGEDVPLQTLYDVFLGPPFSNEYIGHIGIILSFIVPSNCLCPNPTEYSYLHPPPNYDLQNYSIYGGKEPGYIDDQFYKCFKRIVTLGQIYCPLSEDIGADEDAQFKRAKTILQCGVQKLYETHITPHPLSEQYIWIDIEFFFNRFKMLMSEIIMGIYFRNLTHRSYGQIPDLDRLGTDLLKIGRSPVDVDIIINILMRGSTKYTIRDTEVFLDKLSVISFDLMDTNSNNMVDLNEVTQYVKKHMLFIHHSLTTKEGEGDVLPLLTPTVFKNLEFLEAATSVETHAAFDQNQDGVINLEEWITLCNDVGPLDHADEKEIRDLFNAFDANSDELITKVEWERMILLIRLDQDPVAFVRVLVNGIFSVMGEGKDDHAPIGVNNWILYFKNLSARGEHTFKGGGGAGDGSYIKNNNINSLNTYITHGINKITQRKKNKRTHRTKNKRTQRKKNKRTHRKKKRTHRKKKRTHRKKKSNRSKQKTKRTRRRRKSRNRKTKRRRSRRTRK